jgi:hypothetical protein
MLTIMGLCIIRNRQTPTFNVKLIMGVKALHSLFYGIFRMVYQDFEITWHKCSQNKRRHVMRNIQTPTLLGGQSLK